MTFGVSRDQGALEWAGTSLRAIFAQRRNVLSLRMWRMIFDIIRFNQFALDLLTREEPDEKRIRRNGCHIAQRQESIGQYLDREGYSDAFRDDYLLPMAAGAWSRSPDDYASDFPAVVLIRLMYVPIDPDFAHTHHLRWNHHLLTTIGARPQWMTLKYGAKSYIDAVMKGFPPNHLFLNTTVHSITNDDDGRVCLHIQGGKSEVFDHVILATQGDEALRIIEGEADREERDILGAFKTIQSTVILHDDLSLMPKRRIARSAWNYMTTSSPISSSLDRVCLTYNMNVLQHIPRSVYGDVLVTSNPLVQPPAERVQGRYRHSRPLYNAEAIVSQSLLPRIQNTRGISYCGAWTKYGFQEDGFSSGLKAAQDHLGARLPFELQDSTFSRGRRPVLGFSDHLLRICILFLQMLILILERCMGMLKPKSVNMRKTKKLQ